MLKYRKFITSTVGFTFVVVGITGVIFKFWLKNHALEEIHGWLGLALVAAACFHIFQNWSSLSRHLTDKRVWALAIPIVAVSVAFATEKEPPPRGLNPRRVVQQLTAAQAEDVARVFRKDVSQVLAAMKRDGLGNGGAGDTLAELAEKNQQPPEKVLDYFAK